MLDYRALMESLDAIANESDDQSMAEDNSKASYDDVVGHLKDMTTSIISILDSLKSGDADMNLVCKDLQKASDILSGLAYNDSTQGDEGVSTDVNDDDSTEQVEEDVGVDGDEPSVDSQEHRSYKEKGAPSFSARNGFTG